MTPGKIYKFSDADCITLRSYLMNMYAFLLNSSGGIDVQERRDMLRRLFEISEWLIINGHRHQISVADSFNMKCTVDYIHSILCDSTRDARTRQEIEAQTLAVAKFFPHTR